MYVYCCKNFERWVLLFLALFILSSITSRFSIKSKWTDTWGFSKHLSNVVLLIDEESCRSMISLCRMWPSVKTSFVQQILKKTCWKKIWFDRFNRCSQNFPHAANTLNGDNSTHIIDIPKKRPLSSLVKKQCYWNVRNRYSI